jgi:hypothetical protein
MNLEFEANRIKDICETKQGNKRIVELCKIILDIHQKGKQFGYQIAVKKVYKELEKIKTLKL